MRSHEKRVNVCPRTQGKYLVSVVLTAVFAIDRVAVWNAAVLYRYGCRCRRISSGRASGQRNLRERTGGIRSNNVEEHDGHIASRRDGKRYDYATEERTKRNV